VPSPELTAILGLIPADFADPAADYQAVRAMMGPFHGHPVPAHIDVGVSRLGGVGVGHYREHSASAPDDRVAFHCHGGGLVSCPLESYHFYGAMLVEQLGLPAVLPDYRLAPEQPYPAALLDCLAAYRGLLESGTDPTRVVVTGDSCGGGLALCMLLAARDEGLAMPAGFVSVSGWFDLSVAQPNEGGSDPFLTAEWVRHRGRDYTAGVVALDDPRVSPAYADLRGLPPLYVPVAEHDTLRHGAARLARAANDAGVTVWLEEWPGCVHGWEGLVSAGVPEALAVWQRTRQVVNEWLPT
jgi:monoterpene epsilon-lactone hydrolase